MARDGPCAAAFCQSVVSARFRSRLCRCLGDVAESGRIQNRARCGLGVDRSAGPWLDLGLVRNCADRFKLSLLDLRPEVHSTLDRFSAFERGPRADSDQLLDIPGRAYLAPALVRHCNCNSWPRDGG